MTSEHTRELRKLVNYLRMWMACQRNRAAYIDGELEWMARFDDVHSQLKDARTALTVIVNDIEKFQESLLAIHVVAEREESSG